MTTAPKTGSLRAAAFQRAAALHPLYSTGAPVVHTAPTCPDNPHTPAQPLDPNSQSWLSWRVCHYACGPDHLTHALQLIARADKHLGELHRVHERATDGFDLPFEAGAMRQCASALLEIDDPDQLGTAAAAETLLEQVQRARIDAHLPDDVLVALHRVPASMHDATQLFLSPRLAGHDVALGTGAGLYLTNATVAARVSGADDVVTHRLAAPLSPEQVGVLAQSWEADLDLREQVDVVLAATR